MKKTILFLAITLATFGVKGQEINVTSPDSVLIVNFTLKNGVPTYAVNYNGKCMLENSPLGFVADIGDFSRQMALSGQEKRKIEHTYTQDRIKRSLIRYEANELNIELKNAKQTSVNIVFRVSNNNVAFRYEIPKTGETGSLVIREEKTGFNFPAQTTTFLCPQSKPMIGWKRTKPSYEEEYLSDAHMNTPSRDGLGYTFPGLFHIGDNGWVLVSETGVDSKYCASHLSDATPEGLYTIAFPIATENNGNGTSEPGLALPGKTPWRTLTVGSTLKPIVETTIPWDVVEPRYESEHTYRYGRSTWSWILWQDASINFEDQIRYIDLAAAMGYEYTLIDNWWDMNIGRERIEELARYAHSKGISLFLWYSSSGYWNDIVQGPIHCMDDPIVRKREMKWMQKIGVKGIKVDFFGGDKQETMRLYESILSDADDYGLMVIFHGCTLPRGWERMYPNYVGSEAVLASENQIFSQHFCDNEAFNACLHPFIRNTVGSMDFGGTFLNKMYNRTNDGGCVRRTSDVFQLATAVLFQNPIQNFALAPNNLSDAPKEAIEFMKRIPTTWDETVFIDGYPGKYIILARRHGNRWYVAGINGGTEPLKLKLDFRLPIFSEDRQWLLYTDGKQQEPVVSEIAVRKADVQSFVIQPGGGVIWESKP